MINFSAKKMFLRIINAAPLMDICGWTASFDATICEDICKDFWKYVELFIFLFYCINVFHYPFLNYEPMFWKFSTNIPYFGVYRRR